MMTVIQRREWESAGARFYEITTRLSPSRTELVIPVGERMYRDAPLGAKLTLVRED